MLKPVGNYVIVRVDTEVDDTVQLSSGVDLKVDTGYKPQEYKRISGEVVSVPDNLRYDEELYRYELGRDLSTANYKYENFTKFYDGDIKQEVQEGETIYFEYLNMNQHRRIPYGDEWLYMIPYNSIIAREIDGDLKPVGGHVLLEKYWGKDIEEIDTPSINGMPDLGKFQGRTTETGLVKEIVSNPHLDYAVVTHVPEPLNGDMAPGIESGDIVTFEGRVFYFKNTMLGKERIVMRYWDIMAVVGNVNNTESSLV